MAVGEKVGDLYAELGLHSSLGRDVEREMGVAQGATQRGVSGIAARAGGLSHIGGLLTKFVTLPIAGIGGAAIKTAVDFDDSMTKIVSLVGISRTQVDAWAKDLEKLGPEVGKSPKELADALFFVTSAGFKGKAAIDVLTASAKASAAGLGDVKTVADAVTSAVNTYGIGNLSASRATDILIASVREGKMPAEALAGVLGRVLSVSETMGVSFDQVGAAIASMTRQGLDAAGAATGVRALMTSLIKPSTQARDQLKKYGLTIDDVRKEVATKGLLPALMHLKDRIGDNKDALGNLFPNVRALNAFLILTGKNAKDNAKIFDNLANSTGSTAKAFKIASEDASFKFAKMFATIKVAAVQLGEALLPTALKVVAGVTKLAQGFADLSPTARTAILATLGFMAVIGPILKVVTTFGKLKDILTGVSTVSGLAKRGIGGVASEAAGAAGKTGLFSGALSSIPWGPALIGGAAIAGMFYLAHQHVDLVTPSIDKLKDATKRLNDAEKTLASDQKTVTAKQAEVNRLRREGKTDTDKYRTAVADLGKAEADAVKQQDLVIQAQIDQTAAFTTGLSNIVQTFDRSGIKGKINWLKEAFSKGIGLGAPAGKVGGAQKDLMDQMQRLTDAARAAHVPLKTLTIAIDQLNIAAGEKAALKGAVTNLYNFGKAFDETRAKASKGLGMDIGLAKDETAGNAARASLQELLDTYPQLSRVHMREIQPALDKTVQLTLAEAAGYVHSEASIGHYINLHDAMISVLTGLENKYPRLRNQIELYVNKLLGIPTLRSTQIQAMGIPGSEKAIRAYRNMLLSIPRDLRTIITAVIQLQAKGLTAAAKGELLAATQRQGGGEVASGRFGIINEQGPELVYARPGGGIDVLTHPQTVAAFAGPSGSAWSGGARGGDGAASPLIGELHVHYPTPEPLDVAVPAAIRRAQAYRNDY